MKDDVELKNDLIALINTSEDYKNMKVDNRLYHAGGHYLRFFNNCYCIYQLLKGLDSPKNPGNKFLDPGSINILSRAALEAYLTFQYVFIFSKSEVEAQLRYDVWLRYGLKFLTKIKPSNPELVAAFKNVLIDFDKIKCRIEQNAFFNSLDKKVKNAILKCENWRLPQISSKGKLTYDSYSTIAIASGFSKEAAWSTYKFLSGYSHSGSHSVNQVLEAIDEGEKEIICDSSVALLKILIRIMLDSYKDLFSRGWGINSA